MSALGACRLCRHLPFRRVLATRRRHKLSPRLGAPQFRRLRAIALVDVKVELDVREVALADGTDDVFARCEALSSADVEARGDGTTHDRALHRSPLQFPSSPACSPSKAPRSPRHRCSPARPALPSPFPFHSSPHSVPSSAPSTKRLKNA